MSESPRLSPLPRSPRTPLLPTLLAAGALLLAWRIVYNTWAAEDAFITLRTAENFLHGHGLTWNADERVQSYTHPLWLMCMIVARTVLHRPLSCLYALGWIASMSTIAILFLRRERPLGLLTALLLLAASKAFVEFSTSGLENPLSHLLLALFVYFATRSKPSLERVTLVAALLFTDRIDAALLIAPWLLYLFCQRARQAPGAAIKALCIGALPAISWELFSAFYYGALVPNTAYAKLQTGWTLATRVTQTMHYVATVARFDPATLIGCGACIVLLARRSDVRGWLGLAGFALFMFYLFLIGGDFMCGRFFSAPLLLLVATMLFTTERPIAIAWPMFALALVVASMYYTHTFNLGHKVNAFGVADEREFFSHTWLFAGDGKRPRDVSIEWEQRGAQLRDEQIPLYVDGNVGLLGYAAGPQVYVVDLFALTDPLLARLVARSDIPLRIGHFFRLLPHGYLESLRTGRCELDRALCPLFDDLRLVTRGPLFAKGRWRALARLLLDAHRVRHDLKWATATPELRHKDKIATDIDAPITLDGHGIRLVFDHPRFIQTLTLTVDGGRCYTIRTQDLRRIECNLRKRSPPRDQLQITLGRSVDFIEVAFDYGLPEPRLYGLEPTP